jgi:hypothetical protein
MAVFIGTNTTTPVKKRLAVDRAVRGAIGEREGTWRVRITESAGKDKWDVIVKGPNSFHWAHHFCGVECTPLDMAVAIASDLEKWDLKPATALSGLVKDLEKKTSISEPSQVVY